MLEPLQSSASACIYFIFPDEISLHSINLIKFLSFFSEVGDFGTPITSTEELRLTVLPALRVNSCIAIDRLMIELLYFHIPFLSFTNGAMARTC